MKKEEVLKIIEEVSMSTKIADRFSKIGQLTNVGSGVYITITTDFNKEYIEFYFGKNNLYAVYEIEEISLYDIIRELDKFLFHIDEYKKKRNILIRDFSISEILNESR
jgi:hypothetical protein